MMKHQVSLFGSISGDLKGFTLLASFHSKVNDCSAGVIEVDCSSIDFLGANLCAVLGGIRSKASQQGKELVFVKPSTSISNIWNRNHFLPLDPSRLADDPNKTVIHFRAFNVVEDDSFKDYINRELLGKQDMPQMTDRARKKILESIYEIFSNAVIHSNCDEILTCGQYFPNRHKLEFTIVDMGRTFKSNVSEFHQASFSGVKAIEWAVKEANTTKKGRIPGGLGLAIIRRFLKLNQGKIQILSADGFWQEDRGEASAQTIQHEFPGTIVNLTFNMSDANHYRDAAEPRDAPIF